MNSPGTTSMTKFPIHAKNRSPEAGDTRTVRVLSKAQACGSGICLPTNLLSDYTMQWALNRTLALANTGQMIRVNAYKLATQSDAFWDLIRLTNARHNDPIDVPNGDEQSSDFTPTTGSQRIRLARHIQRLKSIGHIGSNTLLVDCPTPEAISDLLLAVYFCHTEYCHILSKIPTNSLDWTETMTGWERKIIEQRDPGDNPLDGFDKFDVIYRTAEWILCKGFSICTLSCALRVATTYGIRGLREQCHVFIETHLNLSNCWQMWRSTTINYPHPKDQSVTETLYTIDPISSGLVERYILTNIRHLIRSPADGKGIGMLTCEEMEYFLSSNELNVRDESEVIQAISQWMRSPNRVHDIISCFVSTPHLLAQCIRIDQLGLNDLKRIYEFPCLKDRLRSGQTSNSSVNSNPGQLDSLVWKQIRRSRAECHAVFGQIKRKLVRYSRNLRPLGERPKRVSERPTRDHNYASIGERFTKPATVQQMEHVRIPHETILLFGGWKSGRPCRDVSVFDSRQKTWTTYSGDSENEDAKLEEVMPRSKLLNRLVLPYALMSFGITLVANRHIYIAGGELANTQTTSQVIRFDVTQSIESDDLSIGWKLCSPLYESRRDLVLVNVKDIALYAIGGDNNRAVLNCMERYTLDRRHRFEGQGWCMMPHMLIPRGAPAADALHDIIYVCGGYTESRMESLTNSCEAFDTRTNQWTFIEPMSQARYYAHAVAVQGVLFVLGGGGESGTRGGAVTRVPTNAGYISTVERYNPETANWELMPPATERADFAACLFEGELVCMGGGGATFGTDEVERWTPWLPASTQTLANQTGTTPLTSLFLTDNSINETETSVPLWLTPSLIRSSQQESLGWQSYVRLPTPVWGHRCVVLRGIDRIRPYLNRDDRSTERTRPTCRLVVKSLRAKCTLISGHPILTVPTDSVANSDQTVTHADS
ncbi:Kelch protein 4 [Fasciolopsis buskii]|uniref:Kelch protein 4 n=1 Tax=Fasciolopsis buskii TaxID=27845 RepID=A0A8E0RTD9_9TREM|nr:Kelch protein 4 [Fasciolopsis buski]